MKKLFLVTALLLIPSLASASGFVFAEPKLAPYIQPDSRSARGNAKGTKVNHTTAKQCDPSYPTICLRPGAPDLNCRDIGFANFRVVGNDPHKFDRDGDGVGCEAAMSH